MQIRSGVKSDIGQVRQENEDSYGCFPEQRLFVVADGIGGQRGGALASSLTVATIAKELANSEDDDLTAVVDPSGLYSVEGRRLVLAFESANEHVVLTGRRSPRHLGMGSTAAALLFDDYQRIAVVAHAGDTRIYRLRSNSIERITRDHTVAEELFGDRRFNTANAPNLAATSILTRAIGLEEQLQPDLWMQTVQPGDTFLLASDGLHSRVSETEILAEVNAALPDVRSGCEGLVRLANERGGQDNITALLVVIDPSQSSQPSRRSH